MNNKYKGSCLCGGVKFSVTSFNAQAAHCHCSMCRKFHGAAFGTLVEVKNLKWISGEHLLKDFTAENGSVRTFCSHCGSSLGFRVKGVKIDKLELAIATFDCDIPVKIDAQIYTRYRASWCELQSDLLNFTEGRVG